MTAERTARLDGLDLFRGLTVAFMILVNNPGSWGAIFAPLKHAEWHGLTPTDLVFPFFVFITGASMAFSVEAARAKGVEGGELARRHFKRCALVFVTGVALNGFPFYDLAMLRIPGVLQRIALASLLAGVFVRRGVKASTVGGLALLAIHTAILLLVPAPGREVPSLERGGDVGAALDLWIFGKNHLWIGGGGVYDPEGLLGTLSTASTALFGAVVGDIVRRLGARAALRTLLNTAAAAVLLSSAVELLVPTNKALWTASFVLVTGGFACLGLALALLVTDVLGRRGGPISIGIAYGRNPLLLFVASGVVARLLGLVKIGDASVKDVLYRTLFASWAPPIWASLLWAISLVTAFALVALFLDRRRLHLRF